MKNIDKIRQEIITYFSQASAGEIRDVITALLEYDISITQSYLDCTLCEKKYGPCSSDDLDKDHCKKMFLRYCEEETE